MRRWPLGALARIRDAEARAAEFDAGQSALRAREDESAAARVEGWARELRTQAGDRSGGSSVPNSAGAGWTTPAELSRAAGRRAQADGESRVMAAEHGRAVSRAGGTRAQAGRASARAAAARGRSDALARGESRHQAALRSAREAGQEREAEESWIATASARRPV